MQRRYSRSIGPGGMAGLRACVALLRNYLATCRMWALDGEIREYYIIGENLPEHQELRAMNHPTQYETRGVE